MASLRRRIHPGSIAPRRLIESGKPERPLSSFFLRIDAVFPTERNLRSFYLRRRSRSRRTHAPCLYKDFIENAPVARLQPDQPSTAGYTSLSRILSDLYCIVLPFSHLYCWSIAMVVEWRRVKASSCRWFDRGT